MSLRQTSARIALAAALFASAASAAAADNFSIDREHSTILFNLRHMGAGHTWGTFKDFQGDYSFDAKDISKSKFNVTIKTASLDSFVPKRDEHLRSPDFFNTKQFPTIAFKSTAVSGTPEKFQIKGDITILGVTKPVILDAVYLGEGKDPKGNVRQGWDARTVIKRTDFGMKYGAPDLVGDDVAVTISVEGIKK